MMQSINIVVGAGSIGQAVADKLACENTTYLVSRSARDASENGRVINKQLDTTCADEITSFLNELKANGNVIQYLISTIGVLHQSEGNVTLQPEKKLEDLNTASLLAYFETNTIVPMLWVKGAVDMMKQEHSAVVCLSARVGSISDNRLGGWYGYRASKAALNMMMKTAAVEYARRAKQTSLVCYHPGTVDSNLSKPFQRNVKEGKLFSPDYTATQLVSLLSTLEPQQSPYFVDWDHKPVSW